jgi:hypothetical protein
VSGSVLVAPFGGVDRHDRGRSRARAARPWKGPRRGPDCGGVGGRPLGPDPARPRFWW